ncbi:serine protease [Ramlibacter henchirensis]|uniref:Serine protease n=1 Tax=Ramlibacter henchirensis TaxID=204072 RepID=A0A4Z0C3N7_9BURK|nr:serine protease [Ramlibacter henchirensis]
MVESCSEPEAAAAVKTDRNPGLGSALVAALLCVSTARAQEQPLSAEELYERISPSVWMVEVRRTDSAAMGSAVVTAPGTLITNCHVVAKTTQIVVSHGSQVHAATVRHRDPTRDLCELRAPGVVAPAVNIGDWSRLRIGAKLYAIGNPRGLELTLSDGLLSGIRRDSRGALEALQISVPISPGSSGGGLFDTYGRLVGITTGGFPDAQNIGFALPATWIAELPRRAGMAPGTITPDPGPSPAPQSPEDPARIASIRPPHPQHPESKAAPAVFEYQLRDRLTGLVRRVVYRVDRREAGLVVINGGTRVEDVEGRVVTLTAAIAGEFEEAMPPGGWVLGGKAPDQNWSGTYMAVGDGRPFGMELRSAWQGEEMVQVAGRALRAMKVQFKGFTTRGGGARTNPPGSYSAVAWYSPELGRVVRFEARTRGGLGHTAFVVDEVLELTGVRSE